ncbi:MAG: hypothetical protein RSB05_01380 [Clostridiales bacterium]
MNNIMKRLQQVRNLAIKIEPGIKPNISDWKSFSTDSILPFIFLLPYSDIEVEDKHMEIAAAFLFLQISQNCHAKVVDENSSDNYTAILYGDLFYSHAYKILESKDSKESLTEIAKVMVKINESWFYHQDLENKANPTLEEFAPAIHNELGLLMDLAASKSWEDAKKPKELQSSYQECTAKIALLWGARMHRYPLNFAKTKNEILNLATTINFQDEIKIITDNL